MTVQSGKAEVGRGKASESAPSTELSTFPRYRAPREDGQALFDPAWEELPALVHSNRSYAASLEHDFHGTPLAELRASARRALSLDVLGKPAGGLDKPLILTGHQPELFHPGVWLKNFAAGGLAKRVDGHGVNVVIDSDLCRSPSVNAPAGEIESPRVEVIPFDGLCRALPHEERLVVDHAVLESFSERVAGALSGLIEEPLVQELWPEVLQEAARSNNLSRALSAGRHRFESRWGNTTWETSISRVCDAAPFRSFVVDVLARLPEFHTAHNQALAEYRRAHRLRTPAQPMPNLHERNGWLEAPLWVWTKRDPTRRALYARPSANGLVLSDLAGGEWAIDLHADPTDQLAELRAEQGLKLRSRALITTLYARLLLADLFLHGIGGAKYDQAADLLAERFYGFAPPRHATLSATLRLPIAHGTIDPHARTRIARELRELEFHPDRFLTNEPAAREMIAEKRRWIASGKDGQAAARHLGITRANASMQPLLNARRQALLEERDLVAGQLRAASVLGSREYSFCLFPEPWLRERLIGIVGS